MNNHKTIKHKALKVKKVRDKYFKGCVLVAVRNPNIKGMLELLHQVLVIIIVKL